MARTDFAILPAECGSTAWASLSTPSRTTCASRTRSNKWWFDVLENGPSSPYASFFDIDWHPPKADLANKVLLPVLGDQFGHALENGQISIAYGNGAFEAAYYDHVFPLAPRTWTTILEPALARLTT